VLGVLDCDQALFKSADVSRIVGESVIWKANLPGVILAEESVIVSSEKPGSARPSRSALRIRWFALHHALTFFEPFNFIDELFSSIRVIDNEHYTDAQGSRGRKEGHQGPRNQ